ncbi:MAG: inorganic phosphate transporter [Halobacteriales archaeon]|nr:inorganic phosphate transporter [Halobacteriales archaeon]
MNAAGPGPVATSTMASLIVVAVAILGGLFMAWALGASSNSPPFAPAVGANALPTMRAALLIGIFAGLGAVAQGSSISETVGTGLIDGVAITPLAAAAGLLTAAGFIAMGVGTGYPIPAAFAVTGAMVGVGLALGGDPAYDTYERILAFWAAVPIVSGSIAYGTATLLRRDDIPETVGVPLLGALVGFIVANIPLAFVPAPAGQGTFAGFASRTVGVEGPILLAGYGLVEAAASLVVALLTFLLLRRQMRRSVADGIRQFLVGLGALVAFSSGGSQVGLATGPLETLFSTQLGLPDIVLLVFGGTGILLGAWMGSPRLLQAVAREYSTLGVRRSIAALVPGFIIAQAAIALGIPISFNNIIISSVIGSGLVEGSAGVSRRKIGRTAVVWITTLLAAGASGYGLYTALSLIPGAA